MKTQLNANAGRYQTAINATVSSRRLSEGTSESYIYVLFVQMYDWASTNSYRSNSGVGIVVDLQQHGVQINSGSYYQSIFFYIYPKFFLFIIHSSLRFHPSSTAYWGPLQPGLLGPPTVVTVR